MGFGIIRSGWLFVDFFFVLSGFVITHACRTEIAHPGDALQFIRRRFFRLYPLHFCTLCAVLAWSLLFYAARMIGAARFPELFQVSQTNLFDGLFEKIVRHLILLQGFVAESDVGLNGPSWSISVEFWTYILFAICCLALGARLLWGQVFLTVTSLSLLYALSGAE